MCSSIPGIRKYIVGLVIKLSSDQGTMQVWCVCVCVCVCVCECEWVVGVSSVMFTCERCMYIC